LKEIWSNIEELIKATGQNGSQYEIETKVIGLCPVVLKFENLSQDNTIELNKKIDIDDAYVVVINNKTYEIHSTSYEDLSDSTGKRISTITLLAISSLQSCQFSGTYPSIGEVKNNQNLKIILRAKTISDFRRDYFKIGVELNTLNKSIEKNKEKITKLVDKYNKQRDINKGVDLRSTIYFSIFGIIFLTYVIIYFLKIDDSTRMQVMLSILLLITIMIVINWFMNYSYIENFSNIENFH
jgi:hypothetical protein